MGELSIDRSLIADPPAKEKLTDDPRTLLDSISGAISMGLDWEVVCEYNLDGWTPVGAPSPHLRRRYRFTAWPRVDKAEMREALANLELQRDKRTRAANALDLVREQCAEQRR